MEVAGEDKRVATGDMIPVATRQAIADETVNFRIGQSGETGQAGWKGG